MKLNLIIPEEEECGEIIVNTDEPKDIPKIIDIDAYPATVESWGYRLISALGWGWSNLESLRCAGPIFGEY